MNKEIGEALSDFKREYESCNHNNSDLIIELETAENILQYIDQLESKVTQLEAEKKKVIEKLKKDLKKNNEIEIRPLQIGKAYNNYYKMGKIDEIQEILEIMRGENE